MLDSVFFFGMLFQLKLRIKIELLSKCIPVRQDFVSWSMLKAVLVLFSCWSL